MHFRRRRERSGSIWCGRTDLPSPSHAVHRSAQLTGGYQPLICRQLVFGQKLNSFIVRVGLVRWLRQHRASDIGQCLRMGSILWYPCIPGHQVYIGGCTRQRRSRTWSEGFFVPHNPEQIDDRHSDVSVEQQLNGMLSKFHRYQFNSFNFTPFCELISSNSLAFC